MWGTEGLPDLINVFIPRQSRATNTPHHAQPTLPLISRLHRNRVVRNMFFLILKFDFLTVNCLFLSVNLKQMFFLYKKYFTLEALFR